VETVTVGEQLGQGGPLYKDGLEPVTPTGEEETNEERLRRRIMDKLKAAEKKAAEKEAKKEEKKPEKPPWEVKPMHEPPKEPRDWRGLQSTMLEIFGVLLVSVGFGMWQPWLGVVVLGTLTILMGVALGLPDGHTVRKPRRRQ
jgi:hypothetical protein